ncbi:chorismate--pyruvate lyase [Pectobacterium brasiliense]|uniref:chorismate lyase n=1 Tax=Pectobacterium brasiliense TaxID=180957 RepID=UPI0004E703BB|nr:chorismate lyase [Pectobacterium brasiliense]KFF67075.1 chorismate--pyruvate lyase [Pectobacterium brasiliense]
MSDDASTLLRSISWFTEPPSVLPEHIGDWLMETGSMTRRLEKYCAQLKIILCSEKFITPQVLGEEREQLPYSERYWLREVVLYGDDRPWLFGRTIVPQQTLDGTDSALTKIGNQPLGRYLFGQKALTRDYIHTGCSEGLWARRSRLCVSGYPLLLTELFLPESPIYFSR